MTLISFPIVQPALEGELVSTPELVISNACRQLLLQFDGTTSNTI